MNKNIKSAFGVFLITLLIGTLGYKAMLADEISLFDSFYMTVITISTVGFGETVDLSKYPWARLFTVALLFIGMGNLMLIVSFFTSNLVDLNLNKFVRRRKMLKRARQLSDHVIMCGVGRLGHTVLDSYAKAVDSTLVVIDRDEENVAKIIEKFPSVVAIVGDATDEEILKKAGISVAKTLITCLPDDRDNLFVTMSARQLNTSLQIVAIYHATSNAQKLIRAGANEILSPPQISGRRLVTMLLQPTINDFLDHLLDVKSSVKLEEIVVEADDWAVNNCLGDLKIPSLFGLQVIGSRGDSSKLYVYCPRETHLVVPNSSLVVVGTLSNVNSLKAFLKNGPSIK